MRRPRRIALVWLAAPFLLGVTGRTPPLAILPGTTVACVLMNVKNQATLKGFSGSGSPPLIRLIDDSAGNSTTLCDTGSSGQANCTIGVGCSNPPVLGAQVACVLTYQAPQTPAYAPSTYPHTLHCEFNFQGAGRYARGSIMILDSANRVLGTAPFRRET